jgi:hypothetical protein
MEIASFRAIQLNIGKGVKVYPLNKSKKVLAFFAILYYNTEINKRRLFEARKEQNCHERKN